MTHIAVSILNADLTELGRVCHEVEAAGANSIQVDVMDGHFVPELSFGPQVAAAVAKNTALPVEAHLMVERPRGFVDAFAAAGVRDFIFHVEATDDLTGLASLIRGAGMRPGVAIKASTATSMLVPYLHHFHIVVVMGVEPGRGGQLFNPSCLETLRTLRNEVTARGIDTQLQVDGGMNDATAPLAVASGADALIAGSYLFRHPGGYAAAIQSLATAGQRQRP